MTSEKTDWKTSINRFLVWLLSCLFLLVDFVILSELVRKIVTRIKFRELTDTSEASINQLVAYLQVFDRWMLFIFGCFAIILALFLERYLRVGSDQQQLRRRGWIVFGIEIAFGLVFFLLLNFI